MNFLYLIIFFVFGLFMGSFYTVVGLRLPKKENFMTNRSYCDHCHHTLSMLDMIPILSYIFLKGKCRYCHKKISDLSSYMELFTGLLFALSYYVFGFSYQCAIALGVVSLLIMISVSDISYYIIPDELLIVASGYFLIIITISQGVIPALYATFSGGILFSIMYVIMKIGNFVFQKESLGGGDVKMMFVFGILLHPLLGIFSIFLGSLLALPVSLMILYRRKQNLVPFGPFLLISLTFIYFTKINVPMILEWIQSF